MREGIHPEYFKETKISCACGNEVRVGGTVKEQRVEICSSCHPYFSGQAKLVDTAGRVDKFEARRKKAALFQKSRS